MPASPAQSTVAKERRAAALRMQLEGWSFTTIGRALGCSRQRAAQLVQAALAAEAGNAPPAAQIDAGARIATAPGPSPRLPAADGPQAPFS